MYRNIKSMTGYGKGVVEVSNKRISVEVKSLNSKQLDCSVKIPATYRDKEFDIRSKVSKTLVRGKVEVYINVELIDQKQTLPINTELFREYLNQLYAIDTRINVNADFVQAIITLPGVLQTEKKDVEQEEWNALDKAVDTAICEMDKFRVQEGNILINDIISHIDTIGRLKGLVEPFENERIEAIKKRIRENMEKMVVEFDNSRFEQEMIYYIEKLDITEEKVRLENHLNYFKAICREEDNVGRKLGFVAQEIGREINTMGSKSNNSQMQKIVVEMKDELEKIKEQSLNIL